MLRVTTEVDWSSDGKTTLAVIRRYRLFGLLVLEVSVATDVYDLGYVKK